MDMFRVTFLPDNIAVSIHRDATVLDAANKAQIIINTPCGQKGTCGKCKVILDDNSEVLACQHKITGDMTVTVPPAARFYKQKILTETASSKAVPDIYEKYSKQGVEKIFGLAIDIGTTTVVVELVDLRSGDKIAVSSDSNPQAAHGYDVISRIQFADSSETLGQMRDIIVNCINQLIDRLCSDVSIKNDDIYEASVVGNTVMMHLLLNKPVDSLGRLPFSPLFTDSFDINASDIGIVINPAGNIHTNELIAGFVGADTTAAALACEMDKGSDITLLVDIGTNGEIVLGDRGFLVSASCAAGPAFEGAKIAFGSRAVAGAIEACEIANDDIQIETIDDVEPRSICGSGLVDVIACLVTLGVIDKGGKIVMLDGLSEKIKNRIIEIDDQPAFVLSPQGRDVYLTQRDVREFQVAKSAIRTGIEILMKKLNIENDSVSCVYLAGAFGNYIKKRSALDVGLLPEITPEKIHFVGNAALAGAENTLLSAAWREHASDLAEKINYIEIANEKLFATMFGDFMLFP